MIQDMIQVSMLPFQTNNNYTGTNLDQLVS